MEPGEQQGVWCVGIHDATQTTEKIAGYFIDL